ncbi:MAG TPA: DUF2752 domain-containing protein [Acidimicrobiia bacterium]|nr:DUF2752 domain-containing protein [Acidimicrobiia bacterium]
MSRTWRNRLGYLAPVSLFGALVVAGPIEGGPTLCPFALCTGIACPGCGMTRAASHLIRGDLSGALALHPLILPVAALSVVGTAWYLLRRMGRAGPIPNRWVNTALVLTGVMLLGVWVARALSGTLPPV